MKTFEQLKKDLRETVMVGGIHELPLIHGYVKTGIDDAGVTHFHHQMLGHVAKVNSDGSWQHHTHGQGIPTSGLGLNALSRLLRKVHGK
jgi:hypothetical protein